MKIFLYSIATGDMNQYVDYYRQNEIADKIGYHFESIIEIKETVEEIYDLLIREDKANRFGVSRIRYAVV